MRGSADDLVLVEGQRQGHETEALEGWVLIDWLLLELIGEVSVSGTIGMLAEFPLELVCDYGLESVLETLIEEVAEEEMLLRPPGLGDVGRTIR